VRFDRLQIPAFGPFTDVDIEFPLKHGDLHVLYGANEAGKSSLLRAIRDLLFGIHGQSPDNFLHDYKHLRIKGEIRSQAGERLIFQRRKGNKNTLLDAHGNPLPDQALIPFLGSVDQAYFSAMFGLGTRELREGAEQLLRGEGDIGSALFSASMGGAPVQLVLAALSEESDRLYRGRALANVSIRPAAAKYRELVRQSREAAVNPEQFEKIERHIAAAEKEKLQLEAELHEINRSLDWIARCEDALPTVGRLNEARLKLDALPVLPEVSSDFVDRARAARKDFSEADRELQRLTAQIAKLEAQRAACEISSGVLAVAESLDRLHQDLSVYGERKHHLVDLETALAGLEPALHAGMQNLGLTGSISSLDKVRLTSSLKLACEEAASNLEKAVEEREKLKEKRQAISSQIEARESQLKDLPETDLTALRDALASAAEATEANKTLLAAESEVMRLTREVRDLHRGLIGAPEALDATADLPVPGKAAISRVRDELEEIKRAIRTEETRITEEKRRVESIQAELTRLERRGELPSEQALKKARDHRDHGWSLVLADWKGEGAGEEFVVGTPLEEAFPQAIEAADRVADQLREQAEAVAQAEEKRFQISESEKQIEEAEKTRTELQHRLGECQTAWEALWQPCAITPGTPGEMEEWRECWSDFRERLRQLRAAEESFQRKSNQVRQARKQLASVLADSEEKAFEILFEKARRKVQQGEEATGRRNEIKEQLQALKAELTLHDQHLSRAATIAEAAEENWKSQCRAVGLPEGISPRSGLALLQERAELLEKFNAWKKASTERQKIMEAVRQYERDVNDQCRALGIEGDTTEARVSRLWAALTRGREGQARFEHLSTQIEEAGDELRKSQEARSQAAQALDELMRLAALETPEELEPLLANLESRDLVLSQIATLRDALIGIARGQTVDEFLSRIREEDLEALPQMKEMRQSEKGEKEAARQEVLDRLYGLRAERQRLEAAGDAAANYRQQAESMAARLKEDASRYVRLRLAVHFLQTQIERFRKENQGPLLERSGEVFRGITRGAFAGLAAEFNADDTPVLMGVRPDGSLVPVAGMSDGARDELYLALRLAALERYLEQNEPMPLILDDLLITFDDERAAAILPQLVALAQRTQILLFTHHLHLVELCRRTLGEGGFHLHQLSPGERVD
jgi:uncharacterized protein YhaN